MSVPSAKYTFTTDSPKTEVERILATSGSPFMAVSTG